MKWEDAFKKPDLVGQSEYRAIHDTVAGAVFGCDMPKGAIRLPSRRMAHL